jgi:hypothetical protein
VALRTHLTAGVPLSSTTDTPLSAPPPPNTLRSSPHFSCEQLRTAAQVQREQAGRAAGQSSAPYVPHASTRWLACRSLADRQRRDQPPSAQGRPRVARGKTHVGERKQWGDGAPPVTASSHQKQRPGRRRACDRSCRAAAASRRASAGSSASSPIRSLQAGPHRSVRPTSQPSAAPGGRPNNCTPHVGGWRCVSRGCRSGGALAGAPFEMCLRYRRE